MYYHILRLHLYDIIFYHKISGISFFQYHLHLILCKEKGQESSSNYCKTPYEYSHGKHFFRITEI